MALKGTFECPICLDFYSDHQESDYWISTDCGLGTNGVRNSHVFHNLCLKDSLDNSPSTKCPICRHEVNSNRIQKLNNIDVKPKPDDSIFDHEIKIVVLGKYSVGKTSVVNRFLYNKFRAEHVPTVGVDCHAKCFQMGDKRIKYNLWDTAGQERYRGLVTGYVRNAFGMVFVYDITDRSTFDAIRDWVNFADENGPLNTRRILVGNKLDLEGKPKPEGRVVSTAEGEALADKLKFSAFLECSAYEGFRIAEIYKILAAEMLSEQRILDEASRVAKTIKVKEELDRMPRLERIKLACC